MKKLSVIIARFQTDNLSEGHVKFLKQVVSRSDIQLVLLGTARAKFSKRDPLDYLTRWMMLQKTGIFTNPNFDEVSDQKSNEVWSKSVDSKIDKLLPAIGDEVEVTLYGSRDSFISYYSGKYKTEELHFSDAVEAIQATDRRIEIAKNPLDTADFRAGVIFNSYNRYDTVYPTVDCAIFNEDYTKILLGRKKNENQMRFIGGFVDTSDLSYEMAARREASEETGGVIDGLEYISSVRVNDWRYKYEDKIMTTLFGAKFIYGVLKASDDIAFIDWYDIALFKDQEYCEQHLVGEHAKMMANVVAYAQKKQSV